MLINVGLLLLGGVMLYFGAEWLVRGAAGLARAFGVKPIVIGLTVVSYGTSAPELAVSLVAALEGNPDIALGNVVGSNIANIALILGVTALIAPPKVDGSLIRRELPLLLVATISLPAAVANDLIGRGEALALFAGAVLFTAMTFFWARADPEVDEAELPDEVPDITSKPVLAVLFVVGLAVLIGGGKAFVTGAVGLALKLGMSQRMVGLTIVAFGTSLPELAASLVAAMRGHSELAVGNVVGSNAFNIFLILGATGLVKEIPANFSAMTLDLSVMVVLTFACMLSMRKARRITRIEGGLYIASYVGFIGLLVATH